MNRETRTAYNNWSRYCACARGPDAHYVKVKVDGKETEVTSILAHDPACQDERDRLWDEYVFQRDWGRQPALNVGFRRDSFGNSSFIAPRLN